jgi:molecular chaperone GrpE
MSGTRQEEAESVEDAPTPKDGGEESPDPVRAEIAELRAQKDDLEARLRAVSSAYRQKQDEIASTKDRLTRQAQVQEEIRRGEVVMALFEPVQNLQRSVQAMHKDAPEAARGVEIVLTEFMDALRQLGLEEVPGVGARFDPNVHEAIATVPVAEAEQDGAVIQVFSAGFRIGTRVVRAARVIIGAYTVAEA